MRNYSQGKLTYSKDKLTALSGLAHDYYEREGRKRGKYAAGLWEVDMPSALLWQTVFGDAQRPSMYRAPSWSWASVHGHISYDSQMLESDAQYGGIWLPDEPPSPRESSEYDFGAFRVQGIETTTSPSDPMGAVSAGHITLTGLFATAIIDEGPHTISRSGLPSTYTLLGHPERLVVGALLADVQTEVRPYDYIYCICVRNEQDGTMPKELEVKDAKLDDPYGRSERVMGLGLARIGEEEDGNEFRRVGLVRWVRKELFGGREASTIKIV